MCPYMPHTLPTHPPLCLSSAPSSHSDITSWDQTCVHTLGTGRILHYALLEYAYLFIRVIWGLHSATLRLHRVSTVSQPLRSPIRRNSTIGGEYAQQPRTFDLTRCSLSFALSWVNQRAPQGTGPSTVLPVSWVHKRVVILPRPELHHSILSRIDSTTATVKGVITTPSNPQT
jgi:hypothetical protein